MEDMRHHRQIKSFVRREGRMTPSQKRALEQSWVRFGLSLSSGPIDFEKIFQNKNPVTLEIGFGMGQSLATLASENPTTNFIGVEVHRPGVGKLLSLIASLSLTNIRIYQEDAVEVLKQAIPDSSLARILIFFPDPWHKRRHHKRRLIQLPFIELLHQKLMPHGEVYLATDWEEYAKHMLHVFNQHLGFQNTSKTNAFISRPDFRPITKFEKRGQRLGHGVWDLCFAKNCSVAWRSQAAKKN